MKTIEDCFKEAKSCYKDICYGVPSGSADIICRLAGMIYIAEAIKDSKSLSMGDFEINFKDKQK